MKENSEWINFIEDIIQQANADSMAKLMQKLTQTNVYNNAFKNSLNNITFTPSERDSLRAKLGIS